MDYKDRMRERSLEFTYSQIPPTIEKNIKEQHIFTWLAD